MMKDMTEGVPLKIILWFSLPLLIGNIFQQIYSLSDIIIVGNYLGVHSLAAVGAMTPVFLVMVFTITGFSNGLCIITAQRFGAKDEKGVRKSFAVGLILSFLFAFICSFSLLHEMPSILVEMKVPQEILLEAEQFMRFLAYALLATVFYNYLSGVMRALGDSKTPLYFLIFSCVLNIILNLYFIIVLKMGVAGSGLGTGVAQSCSVLLCILYMLWKFPILKLKKEDFKWNGFFVMQHLKIAFPMAIQFSILGLGVLIIQRACNSLGPETIAAFTAALRIEQLGTLPMVSFGLAMTTFAAQNYGAKLIRRIRQGVLQCSLMSLIYSIVAAVVVYSFGSTLVSVFLSDPEPEVVQMAQKYLKITTLFYGFLGQIFIFRQTLQGMGRALLPLLAGIVELVMRAFAALFLASGLGYIGICYASPIAWIGAASVVSIGYFVVIRRYKITLFQK